MRFLSCNLLIRCVIVGFLKLVYSSADVVLILTTAEACFDPVLLSARFCPEKSSASAISDCK